MSSNTNVIQPDDTHVNWELTFTENAKKYFAMLRGSSVCERCTEKHQGCLLFIEQGVYSVPLANGIRELCKMHVNMEKQNAQ